MNNQANTKGGKNKLFIIIFAAAVVLVAAGLISYYLNASSVNYAPPVMKTYGDSGNYFTIKIPRTWKTQENVSENTTGLTTRFPETRNIEVTQLYVPDEVGVTIQVYEGQVECPGNKPTMTLAGLPAVYDPLRHLWTIPTTSATLIVQTAYPGSGGFHERFTQNPQSPPSQAEVDTDLNLLNTIIKSLKFNNFQPLAC